MSKKRILAIPVDGRPVTREQAQMLASVAGCELLCPSVEHLGHFRQPANREFLSTWVEQNAARVDGFIFSIDMLVYGGLVPSRFVEDTADSLIERLTILKRLKQRYPDKPVYTFCATMRMSNNNVNEEEKLYWAEYGRLIWAWSYHSDRYQNLADADDHRVAKQAREQIPDAIAEDYLHTRKRNFAVTQALLQLARQGYIDRVILPQDDTAEFGFNIAERRQLQQWVEQAGLEQKILIYPGADEVIYTLLVHLLKQLNQYPSCRLVLHIHHPDCFHKMIALYEDRLTYDAIRSQISAAGATLIDDVNDADAIIAVHCRGSRQGDWAMQKPLPDSQPLDPLWLQQLAAFNVPLALLDLAYANGADPELISALPIKLSTLMAYSGWNTASNSIGSLVAQCCAMFFGKNRLENKHLLAVRLLDDYLYQADYRQRLRQRLPNGDTEPEKLLKELQDLYLEDARLWLKANSFGDIDLLSVYLPWQRSFEIGLHTAVNYQEQ